MSKIKIERGIQIPAVYGQYSKYPFGQMRVGDSFQIPDDQQAVRQAASQYARRHNKAMKFSVRKYEDHYRCWRVK